VAARPSYTFSSGLPGDARCPALQPCCKSVAKQRRWGPGELDLERFRDLAERGRDALAAERPDEAAPVLRGH